MIGMFQSIIDIIIDKLQDISTIFFNIRITVFLFSSKFIFLTPIYLCCSIHDSISPTRDFAILILIFEYIACWWKMNFSFLKVVELSIAILFFGKVIKVQLILFQKQPFSQVFLSSLIFDYWFLNLLLYHIFVFFCFAINSSRVHITHPNYSIVLFVNILILPLSLHQSKICHLLIHIQKAFVEDVLPLLLSRVSIFLPMVKLAIDKAQFLASKIKRNLDGVLIV